MYDCRKSVTKGDVWEGKCKNTTGKCRCEAEGMLVEGVDVGVKVII